MGIDAQRSGTSELRERAVEVRRAQGANSGPGSWQRKSTQAPSTTKAIPVWIVEEEQRRDRLQDPCALRVAAEPGPRYRASGAAAARPGGRLAQPPLPPQAAYVGLGLRCGGSTMCTDIACAAAPCIRPPGARNAAICTFTTDCQEPSFLSTEHRA